MAFFILNLILTVAALISCLSAEEGQIKALPRIAWVIIILLFSPIGAIVFFVVGREHAGHPKQTWRPGSGFPEAQRPAGDRRPMAPDDDPVFLKQLSKQQAEDRELMRKWEDDLKRREEEMRKRDQPDG